MTATCEITRTPVTGTTDAVGKWTPAASTVVYTGPCRVQALVTQQQVKVVGEQQETRRRYLVTIRFDAANVQLGDQVEVTDAVDARLIGRRLRVIDVAYGSEQWERDLNCEDLED